MFTAEELAAMSLYQLKQIIKTLEKLEKEDDLTSDGHLWLQDLRREFDRRQE